MKYFCYDTALNEEYTLMQLMQMYPKYTNLFQGTDDEHIWDAAPWLFELNSNPYELKGQMLIQLNHCIVFESKETVREILDYLQSKIVIHESGQTRYFRIWDPRVLLNRLPTWSQAEIQDFFNVFRSFYTESDEEAYLYKWIWSASGKIESSKVFKAEALPLIKTEEELDEEYENSLQQKQAKVVEPATRSSSDDDHPSGQDQVGQPKRRRFLTD